MSAQKSSSSECQSSAMIHNVGLESDFSKIPNSALRDSQLSWAAKGLLCYILSLPPNWNLYVWQLAKIYQGGRKGNGRDAIHGLLRELREFGYVVYIKSKTASGAWQHRYNVYSSPPDDFQEKNKQVDKPDRDQPDRDHPDLVDPDVLESTNLNKTELRKDIIPPEHIFHPPEQPSSDLKMPPAEANNNSFQKNKKKKSSYKCIETFKNLSQRQKSMLMTYPEDAVEQALGFVFHETISLNITGGERGHFRYVLSMLQNPDDYKDAIANLGKPRLNKQQQIEANIEVENAKKRALKEQHEKIIRGFEDRKVYNGFLFRKFENSVEFQDPHKWPTRKLVTLNMNDNNFQDQLEKTLKTLGIDKPTLNASLSL